LTAAGVVLGLVVAASGAAIAGSVSFGDHQVDGTETARGVLLPDDQWVKPAGDRHLVDNGRLLASTLSPDGRYLAAETYLHGTGFLTIMDVSSGEIVQQVGTATSTDDPYLGDHKNSPDAPLYSPDGSTLWFGQAGDLVRFHVNDDGTVAESPTIIPMKDAKHKYLPAGMALSADGSKLYVALNYLNALGVVDTATNTLTTTIPVGNAPRGVVLVGDDAYVSNQGGRPAGDGDFVNTSGGTSLVADPTTGAASTGTVSVVDTTTGTETRTIKVGLQPTYEYRHGRALFVANANNDSVSIIDTGSGAVTQTFNVNPLPGSDEGSNPDSITIVGGHTLLVAIGRDNAIAQYRYDGPREPVRYQGLVPTDWYPVDVQYSEAIGKLVVTNDKGIGARGAQTSVDKGPGTFPGGGVATGHNTYNDTGSVTVYRQPDSRQLGDYTHQVFVNNDWEHLLASGAADQKGSSDAKPVAIPRRLGEPSKIKHVFLVIKENRTYDQILGDAARGNGDPTLAQFGAPVTPNLHSVADQFTLFDNFYDPATLSADGHNWIDQADANDYLEKEFASFYRGYDKQDALLYQRNGFLWDAAERAGVSVRDYGEYGRMTLPSPPPSWQDWYTSSRVLEGKQDGEPPVATGAYPTTTDVPSLARVMNPDYPTFNMDIPDQYRVDIWQQEFAKYERQGTLPQLNIMWLNTDHTNGTSGRDPYPTAMAADNDLAVGRVVDTVSHSRDWKDSAVFVLEDDSQDGVDHVDGHRSPTFIASPYVRHHAVDSAYHTQLNVVRTIEQILGIQPMNQMDRAAEPMYDAFTNTPNFRRYDALPNLVPLTFGLAGTSSSAVPSDSAAAHQPGAAQRRPIIPAAQWSTFTKWVTWSNAQPNNGTTPVPDASNTPQKNRVEWYASTGWTKPYPGDSRILAPNEVPGRNQLVAEN
jgi:YVTN family beta-propeller protein